ncbi:MAG: hypothetical protein J6L85_02515 [Clostridia bacterium]|nr:hypothetical protein [Clostridia bacterium]
MRTVCSKRRTAKLKALVLMLCVSMLFGTVFTSCNSGSNLPDSSENGSADQTVTVFRVVKDMSAGAKITAAKLEEVVLPKSQIAIGAISDPELFSGKYAAIDLEVGDILVKAHISDEPVRNKVEVTLEKKNFGFKDLGYVVVTDHVTPNKGDDLADALQKIFDMKTSINKVIYFPEGEYIISKPLKTSANGTSSISIKLSPNAIIKAADNWDRSNGAMIQLGEKNQINNIDIIGSNYYIEGGIIDGNGKADGIALNGGRETSIRNLSVINTDTGVFWNKKGQVADSDLENVTIIGNGKIGSIGIRIEGSDSTFTNMRISNVQTGVLVNAPAHIFRNIQVTYVPNPILDSVYESSYGFRSEDHRCWFDTCISEGFSTAFSLSSRGDTLASCVASWKTAYGSGKQVAISATYGKYNGIARSVAAYFSGPKDKCEYLVAPQGGSGMIYDPTFDENAVNSTLYKEYIRTSARTEISE